MSVRPCAPFGNHNQRILQVPICARGLRYFRRGACLRRFNGHCRRWAREALSSGWTIPRSRLSTGVCTKFKPTLAISPKAHRRKLHSFSARLEQCSLTAEQLREALLAQNAAASRHSIERRSLHAAVRIVDNPTEVNSRLRLSKRVIENSGLGAATMRPFCLAAQLNRPITSVICPFSRSSWSILI